MKRKKVAGSFETKLGSRLSDDNIDGIILPFILYYHLAG
jgi:hypothetical protein